MQPPVASPEPRVPSPYLFLAIDRRKLTTFQMSASLSRSPHGSMLKSGGTPFLITEKISPSLEPRFHSLSVRSGAGGLISLPDPPSALIPWQTAQYRV